MKTARHRFAVAILALLVLPVPAWGAVAEEDPIKAELDAARKVCDDTMAAAKAVLLKAKAVLLKAIDDEFDDALQKITAKGDLDGHKALLAEKREAMREEDLPESHPLRKHQLTYIEKVVGAKYLLAVVLEDAEKNTP